MAHRIALPRVACLALLLLARPASATWSIVAVDTETGQVGIAGASCIEDIDNIAGLAPGIGAVASQSVMNDAGRDRGVALLREGRTPREILDEITSPDFDAESWILPGGRSWRQYSVVSLEGPRQAAYTGEDTVSWAGSREEPGVVVAGNLLEGPEVVAQALAAFGAPSSRTDCRPRLADRLVAALWAGSRAGGDRRCVSALSALSAFVEVADPDDAADAPALRIVVPYAGPREESLLRQAWRLLRPKRGSTDENPVRRLRARYLSEAQSRGRPACLDAP